MSNIIDFPTGFEFKVLFELPEDKILHMNKTKSDNCDIEIDGQYGTATVCALTNNRAIDTLLKVFPAAIIIEAVKHNE